MRPSGALLEPATDRIHLCLRLCDVNWADPKRDAPIHESLSQLQLVYAEQLGSLAEIDLMIKVSGDDDRPTEEYSRVDITTVWGII